MNTKIRKIVFASMFAVINYVAFTYGKITIPITADNSTAIHIANAIVVLSAWFLGPIYGGLSGAIGLSIADLLDPRYISTAPRTFITKFLIGFIAGKIARKMKLQEEQDRKEITRICALSAAAGLGFNVIFEPVFKYLYKKYLLGYAEEAAKIVATWTAGTTAINAVICVIISTILYLALYKNFLPKLKELDR